MLLITYFTLMIGTIFIHINHHSIFHIILGAHIINTYYNFHTQAKTFLVSAAALTGVDIAYVIINKRNQ
jgi:uncharacterized membrane protein YobD (UPF0266 family)